MPAVETTLAAWSRTATGEQLDNGPSLDDLGGPAAVADEATELAAGPLLGILASATARSLTTYPASTLTPIAQALQHGLTHPHSPWTLAEALDTLCNHPGLLAAMDPKRLSRLLAHHAGSALTHQTDTPHLARPALAGLLHLAVTGHCNPHQLLLILTDLDATEPPDALEMLPVLLGIAHSHFGDPALLTVLHRLEQHPGLSEPVRTDACFELALAQIKHAAEADNGPQARALLDHAALRLDHVIDHSEARPDALAWLTAIHTVLAFTPDRHHSLDGLLNRLHHATCHHQAWSARLGEIPWLTARGSSQAAWHRLAARIHTTAAHLTQPSWYDAARTLTDVLDIYRAIHAVRAAGPAPGLHTLIHPVIVDAFAHKAGLLHHLRQALEHDFAHHPDAAALHLSVNDSISSFGHPEAEAATAHREQEAGWAAYPQLHGLITRTRTHAPTDPLMLDGLERSLVQRLQAAAPHRAGLFDQHLSSLYDQLRRHRDFVPPIDGYLAGLVEHFLKFLYLRFDAQPNLYADRTAYLGPCPPGQTTRYWPEKALQDDYHRDLIGVFPYGTIHRERPDRGGGRSDLEYEPRPGMRFPIEVKRRTVPFTRAELHASYLAQTANYTVTSVPFALLLVGDHSGHNGGYPHVDDRVWTTLHARSPTEMPRLIVIGVLPIGRAAPSRTR
ncbi:hypothetical protein ABT404_08440 [Streptomyces hyaluromycini]|uniref:Uncharacterized protein n=1 Tax=Streptomyces hyaluromycini TaxID=1377993 RepID=A0ABV1WRM2_9ACTN